MKQRGDKMNVFYLITIILCLSMQNVAKKMYTQKSNGGVYVFGVLTCFSAAGFFIVTSGGFEWNVKIIPYSLAFALAYCTTMIFSVIAINCGSLSLTNLMVSYSLMIPALYGLLFLDEQVSFGFYPGIVLLAVSLFLINQRGKQETINVKWIVSVLLAFLGNGMCTVFQKMQQIAFDGAYKNEFMIIALVSGATVLLVISLHKERKQLSEYAKKGWIYGVFSGICNGILNLFVMVLSARMSASIMFPLISAGGIIVTYLISKFIFKEHLSKLQFVGFVLGIACVIFLNI